MPLVKVKEVIGTSPNGFKEALQNAVKYACSRKQNVTGAKVLGQTVTVQDGKITEYKVNVKFAYLWEEELHK